MRVVLASASPRRKELLKQIVEEFEIIPAQGEEKYDATKPGDIVEQLAFKKALEVAELISRENKLNAGERNKSENGGEMLVIGSDTIVAYDGKVLGKPHDERDACDMLKLLSGNEHQVYTGVALLVLKGTEIKQKKIFHEKCSVIFYEMSDEEIEKYVATGEPMDKAGAYGIQGFGGKFVKKTDGDYNTVVGFPVARIYHELQGII